MALTLSGTNGVVGAGFTVDASGVSVTAGVGTFGSLAAPAAGLTGALPAISGANLTNLAAANLTGTVATGRLPAGSIIQISQTTYDSANNITDASSYQDTGLQASITPTSSSNKILVVIHQTYRLAAASGSAQNGGSIKVLRDSTTISSNQAYLLYNNLSGVSNTLYNYDVYNLQILDSPSTTSSVTYKTQAIVYGSGNAIHLQYAGRSYLTLMEVVA